MSSPTILNTMPPMYTLVCPHGDTRVFSLAATYMVAGVPTPFPLTGDNITLLVKAKRTDTDAAALMTATVGSGLVITNGPGGLFTWTILGTATAPPTGLVTFPPGIPFYWAAKVLSGIDETVSMGTIVFKPSGVSAT